MPKKYLVAFDGFIDSIYDIGFDTPASLAKELLDKSDISCGYEMKNNCKKAGGNSYNYARVLKFLHNEVIAIGTYGYPVINELFKEDITLYSVEDAGETIALEFKTGKIMLYDSDKLNSLNWEKVKSRIDIESLQERLTDIDAVCLINWGEINYSNEIWQGIYDTFIDKNMGLDFLIDLADFSKKTHKEFVVLLEFIHRLSKDNRIVLVCNKNEFSLMEKHFSIDKSMDIKSKLKTILSILNIDILIFHSAKESIAVNKDEIFISDTVFVDNPVILTGCGDTFGAAFFHYYLEEKDIKKALDMANYTANRYICDDLFII